MTESENIDDAVYRIVGMTTEEYKAFAPSTVAEKLAQKLVDEAIDGEGIRALQVVLDRTGGKSVSRKDMQGATGDDIANKLKDMLQNLGELNE